MGLRRWNLGVSGNLCVDLTFVVSFVILRLVVLPIWWVRFLRYGWRADLAASWGPCMHRGMLALALWGGVALHALNLYWFFHICQRTATKLRGFEQCARSARGMDDEPGRLR